MRVLALVVSALVLLSACGGHPCSDSSCPTYQACDIASCVARYSGIEIVTPGQGGYAGHNTPVAATLAVRDPFTRSDPPALGLTVALADGGGGEFSGQLTLADAGYYVGTWDPPSEGLFRMVATYPDAGLSGTAEVTADFTPPTFSVVTPAPARNPGDAGLVADERDPELAGAWRRDELVILTVKSADAIDPSTVQLVVYGLLDGGAQGPAMPAMAVTPASGCGAAYCGSATVDLSKPVMGVFRGQFPVMVSGRDRAGNFGQDAGTLPATRWKWRFDGFFMGNGFGTNPSIGKTGNVYFGEISADVDAGVLFAIAPEGIVRWVDDLGVIPAAAPVGSSPDGADRIYVARTNGNLTALAAVSGEDGGVTMSCTPEAAGAVGPALALGSARVDPEAAPTEAAYAVIPVSGGAKVEAIRPDGAGAQCPQSVLTAPIPGGSAVVTTGAQLFLADTSGFFKSFVLQDAGTLDQRFATPTGFQFTWSAPALNGSTFVAGGQYAFVAGNTDDGGIAWSNSALAGSPGDIVISSAGQAIAGTIADVTIATPSGTTATLSSFPATRVHAAPLIGSDGRIYVVAQTGTVSAWSWDQSQYQPEWSVSTGHGNTPPNIDCSRDPAGNILRGRPGVLYVLTTNGRLHAFVVDSRGIDTTAPWPRYQHDPRNTGNSNVSLSEFSCQ